MALTATATHRVRTVIYISNTSDEEDQVVPLLHKQDQPKERDEGEEGQGRVFGGYCLQYPLPC